MNRSEGVKLTQEIRSPPAWTTAFCTAPWELRKWWYRAGWKQPPQRV